MTDPCPNDTNGDGDCGRKTCARCHPQYQPLPKPEVTALIRDLTRMHGIIRRSFADDEWRWVLPVAAVDLLRAYAETLGTAVLLDGEVTLFGIPVRADEHATAPMLELRRD